MSENDELKAAAQADAARAKAPSRDLTLSDPHPHGHQAPAAKALWTEVGLFEEELAQIGSYIASLGLRDQAAKAWLKARSLTEATTFEKLFAALKAAFPLLRADVAMTEEEFAALEAFRGSVAWDQIDEFNAYVKDLGARPYMDFMDMAEELDKRFPLNNEVDGVKSRAKHPALPAPSAAAPTGTSQDPALDAPTLPGAASPSSTPPATPDVPPTPPVDAPESPAADAPAAESAAPSPSRAEAGQDAR